MMKKFKIKSIIYFVSAIFVSSSCENEITELPPTNESNKIELTVVADTINYTSASISTSIINTSIFNNYHTDLEQYGHCWSKEENPDNNDFMTDLENHDSYTFISNIYDLDANSTYYIKAYIKVNDVFLYSKNQLTIKTKGYGTVVDIDGNTYNTVQIGDQEWMAENLKTTYYADHTEITLITSSTEWSELIHTDKAYCFYDNATFNGFSYGALYTWGAAMNGSASGMSNPSGVQGVCPDGWHLPSDLEFKELEMYLGMSKADADETDWRGTDQGTKLKSTTSWDDGTNESEFLALQAGWREYRGYFNSINNSAYFWSSTEYNSSNAFHRSLTMYKETIFRNYVDKNSGLSVRCVKD